MRMMMMAALKPAPPPITVLATTGPLEIGDLIRPNFQMKQDDYPVAPLPADLYYIGPDAVQETNPVVTDNPFARTWDIRFADKAPVQPGLNTLYWNDTPVASMTTTPYVEPPALTPWVDGAGDSTASDDAGNLRVANVDYLSFVAEEPEYAVAVGDNVTIEVDIRNNTVPVTLYLFSTGEGLIPYDANYDNIAVAVPVTPGDLTVQLVMGAAQWAQMIADNETSGTFYPNIESDNGGEITLVAVRRI